VEESRNECLDRVMEEIGTILRSNNVTRGEVYDICSAFILSVTRMLLEREFNYLISLISYRYHYKHSDIRQRLNLE
jgi:hypothetical protein